MAVVCNDCFLQSSTAAAAAALLEMSAAVMISCLLLATSQHSGCLHASHHYHLLLKAILKLTKSSYNSISECMWQCYTIHSSAGEVLRINSNDACSMMMRRVEERWSFLSLIKTQKAEQRVWSNKNPWLTKVTRHICQVIEGKAWLLLCAPTQTDTGGHGCPLIYALRSRTMFSITGTVLSH